MPDFSFSKFYSDYEEPYPPILTNREGKQVPVVIGEWIEWSDNKGNYEIVGYGLNAWRANVLKVKDEKGEKIVYANDVIALY